MNPNIQDIEKLITTIHQLRGKKGCPWDIRQTTESLTKYLKEEVDELIEAIQKKDSANICEECGDLLYLIIMISEISREAGTFRFSDVIQCIDEKLIRRHPHVFAGKPCGSEAELANQWEQIKAAEKKKNLFDTKIS
jgi:MazG family protein